MLNIYGEINVWNFSQDSSKFQQFSKPLILYTILQSRPSPDSSDYELMYVVLLAVISFAGMLFPLNGDLKSVCYPTIIGTVLILLVQKNPGRKLFFSLLTKIAPPIFTLETSALFRKIHYHPLLILIGKDLWFLEFAPSHLFSLWSCMETYR